MSRIRRNSGGPIKTGTKPLLLEDGTDSEYPVHYILYSNGWLVQSVNLFADVVHKFSIPFKKTLVSGSTTEYEPHYSAICGRVHKYGVTPSNNAEQFIYYPDDPNKFVTKTGITTTGQYMNLVVCGQIDPDFDISTL